MTAPAVFSSLPNFFILGAAKAGTTSLHDLLKQLPEVYFPFSKEPLFFSRDSLYEKGVEWYVQTFYKNASVFPLRGDATPHYLYWSEKVAPRLHVLYPDGPKMIILLRDPAERAYSWYWNMIREGREELAFEAALQAEQDRLRENDAEFRHMGAMIFGYLRGSSYTALLAPFLKVFPKEKFHFILYEDLRNDLNHSMVKVMDFLGLPPLNREFLPVTRNVAALPRSMNFQRWLRKQSAWREQLKAILPMKFRHSIKQQLIKLNLRPAPYEKMAPEIEVYLRNLFADEILDLQDIIGRDLSAWLPK